MTKAERAHLARVAALGCIACQLEGIYDCPAEIHHVRKGQGMSQRASHYRVLPLCPPHHRTGGYGVAFHAGKVAFEARYDTEEALLEQVKEQLRGLDQ